MSDNANDIVGAAGVVSVARRKLSYGSMSTLHSLFLVVESGDDGGLEERGKARIPGLYRFLGVGFVCLFFVYVSRDRGPSTRITAIGRAFCECAGPVARLMGRAKLMNTTSDVLSLSKSHSVEIPRVFTDVSLSESGILAAQFVQKPYKSMM